MNIEISKNKTAILSIISIFIVGLLIGAIGAYYKINQSDFANRLLIISLVLNALAILLFVIYLLKYFWKK